MFIDKRVQMLKKQLLGVRPVELNQGSSFRGIGGLGILGEVYLTTA
jgi:hypothetical protein